MWRSPLLYLLLGIWTYSCFAGQDCPGNPSQCDDNASCIYDAQSCLFKCVCNSGFTGNGTHCEDFDECKNKAHNCHTHAACTNKNSSPGFICKCKAGFEGDGINCADVDECSSGGHNCIDPAVCNNKNLSETETVEGPGFTCECKQGYIGNGTHCLGTTEINSISTDTTTTESNVTNTVVTVAIVTESVSTNTEVTDTTTTESVSISTQVKEVTTTESNATNTEVTVAITTESVSTHTEVADTTTTESVSISTQVKEATTTESNATNTEVTAAITTESVSTNTKVTGAITTEIISTSTEVTEATTTESNAANTETYNRTTEETSTSTKEKTNTPAKVTNSNATIRTTARADEADSSTKIPSSAAQIKKVLNLEFDFPETKDFSKVAYEAVLIELEKVIPKVFISNASVNSSICESNELGNFSCNVVFIPQVSLKKTKREINNYKDKVFLDSVIQLINANLNDTISELVNKSLNLYRTAKVAADLKTKEGTYAYSLTKGNITKAVVNPLPTYFTATSMPEPCSFGWTGKNCSEFNIGSAGVAALIGTSSGFIVLLLIVIPICRWRLTRKENKGSYANSATNNHYLMDEMQERPEHEGKNKHRGSLDIAKIPRVNLDNDKMKLHYADSRKGNIRDSNTAVLSPYYVRSDVESNPDYDN